MPGGVAGVQPIMAAPYADGVCSLLFQFTITSLPITLRVLIWA